jgi:formylglycine-generating enzyme required for sulfatase activity
MKKLVVLFVFVLSGLSVMAQDKFRAEVAWDNAEKAYQERNYKEALEHLSKAEEYAGQWLSSISHLRILCLDKLISANNSDNTLNLVKLQTEIKKYMDWANANPEKRDMDKAKEVVTIENSLPQRIAEAKVQKEKDEAAVRNLNIEMILVKGGTFRMGCSEEQGEDCNDNEKPLHSVTVSSFNMGKYEVTQAQWKCIMGDNPSFYKGDNLPVEQVRLTAIEEFISKLNSATGKRYRLPTEAEWEYAARGGNKSQGYKYSGSNTLSNVGWISDNSSDTTHPVGGKSPNELGIYDMSGNVMEWCSDWYSDYSSSSQTNPVGPSSGRSRMYRGGGWNDLSKYCRVSSRDIVIPAYRFSRIGFRLVCEVE